MLTTRQRVELQERDLLWAQKLNAHGPLSTPYLLTYNDSSFYGAKHRLKDLVGGGYFYKPVKTYRTFTPHMTDPDVYACDEAGDDMLLERKLTHKRSQRLHRYNLHHELFLASTVASIELTVTDSGAEFLSESQLIDRAPSGTREMPCHIEHTGRVWDGKAWAPTYDKSDKSLLPDAYFAINRGGYRAFFLEVDCGNEPTYRTDLDDKSWRATLLKYIKVVESGYYKQHFGVTCGALVLLLFTRPSKMEAVQNLLLELTGGNGKNYIRFKTWQDFHRPYFIPKEVNSGLVKDPWVAVGKDKSGKPHAPIYL